MIKEKVGDSQLPEIKPNQQHYQNGTLEPQLTEEGVFSCFEMSTCVSKMILSLRFFGFAGRKPAVAHPIFALPAYADLAVVTVP